MQAIIFDPAHKLGHLHLGNALLYFGEYQAAIQCYDHAITLDPTNSDSYLNKGPAFLCLCKYKEAIECYDQVITPET